MKIKITADSTCDLSPELIEKYNIGILPLYITKGELSYKDGIDINPRRVYEDAESTGMLYKTAAVNIPDYVDYFDHCLKEYDAVIHFNIGSDFSACYQNACIASADMENVYIVDTRSLSTGSGILVIEAFLMAEGGFLPDEIVSKIKSMIDKVDASFVLDTLKFMRMGGRCSSVAALGANFLKLKPCIRVADSKMYVCKKYRGNMDKVVAQYIKECLSEADDIDFRRIFITHTPTDKLIVDAAKKAVEEYGRFEEVIETDAGCTVTGHSGPNTIGIMFLRK